MAERKGRKIILLDCEDSPKWEGLVLSLWTSKLKREVDEWEVFRAYKERPSVAQVQEAHAIIISGSHHGAYEDVPWIQDLRAKLLDYVKTGARIIGCCFGHQLLTLALGGKVGKNPHGRYVLRVADVCCFNGALEAVGLLQPLQAALASDLASEKTRSEQPQAEETVKRELESHGDCVLERPEGAVWLARSEYTQYEMWALGSNVLSFQFHPELMGELALEKILPSLAAEGKLNEEEAQESRRSLQEDASDRHAFLQVLQHFIDNGLKADNSSA